MSSPQSMSKVPSNNSRLFDGSFSPAAPGRNTEPFSKFGTEGSLPSLKIHQATYFNPFPNDTTVNVSFSDIIISLNVALDTIDEAIFTFCNMCRLPSWARQVFAAKTNFWTRIVAIICGRGQPFQQTFRINRVAWMSFLFHQINNLSRKRDQAEAARRRLSRLWCKIPSSGPPKR